MDHPDEAERMGRAGRALVEERHTLDGYVEQIATIVRGVPQIEPAISDAHLDDAPSNWVS